MSKPYGTPTHTVATWQMVFTVEDIANESEDKQITVTTTSRDDFPDQTVEEPPTIYQAQDSIISELFDSIEADYVDVEQWSEGSYLFSLESRSGKRECFKVTHSHVEPWNTKVSTYHNRYTTVGA